jgi:phage tail sheath gpL-like
MNDLIQLSDAEIAAVAGGVFQSIDIDASQSNTSTITQSATATNSGAVSATSGAGSYNTTVAVGALASNTALVEQANSIRATNVFSVRHR